MNRRPLNLTHLAPPTFALLTLSTAMPACSNVENGKGDCSGNSCDDDSTDSLYVVQPGDRVDTDGDGIADGVALDTDGDGVVDSLDTDGDGVGDTDFVPQMTGDGDATGSGGTARSGDGDSSAEGAGDGDDDGSTGDSERGVFWDANGGYGYDFGLYPDSGSEKPDVDERDGVLSLAAHGDLNAAFYGFDDFNATEDFSDMTTLSITYKSNVPVRIYVLWGEDPGANWAVVGSGNNGFVVPYYPNNDGGAQEIILPVTSSFTTVNTPISTGVELSELRQINFSSMNEGSVIELERVALTDDPIVEELDKFEPPRGSTYLIAGQYVSGTNDYISLFETPAGVMYYLNTNWDTGWSLSGEGGTLAYKSQNYANTFLQMGLYLDAASCGYVQSGDGNAYIDDLGGRIAATNRPAFLRIGYEFDNAESGHGCGNNPAQYKQVYRKIVDRMRSSGVNNVAFVWHSAGNEAIVDQAHLANWYPGDDYVDWIGISIFGHSFEFKITPFDEIDEFAGAHDKPIMIGESSVTDSGSSGWTAWDNWFSPLDNYIHYHDRVKAFSFIHENWSGKFTWTFDSRFNGGLSSDQSNFAQMIAKERYLNASDIRFASDGSSITVH